MEPQAQQSQISSPDPSNAIYAAVEAATSLPAGADIAKEAAAAAERAGASPTEAMRIALTLARALSAADNSPGVTRSEAIVEAVQAAGLAPTAPPMPMANAGPMDAAPMRREVTPVEVLRSLGPEGRATAAELAARLETSSEMVERAMRDMVNEKFALNQDGQYVLTMGGQRYLQYSSFAGR